MPEIETTATTQPSPTPNPAVKLISQPVKPNRPFLPVAAVLAVLLLTGLAFGSYQLGKSRVSAPGTNTENDTTAPGTGSATISATVPNPSLIPVVPADPTAGWKIYTNSQYGFSFKHPEYFNSACCGLSGPILGKPEKILVLADPKTVMPNTDKPFDGFGIYVDTPEVDLNMLEGFSSYIYGQKGSLIKNYQDMMDKEPANTKSGFIMVSGRKGESLQGYTWWAEKIIYVPFPDNKNVLVIVKGDASKGSFDAVFDQILATFKFLDQTQEGDFCGGIAGIPCAEGYKCQLEGSYPDAGGKCVIN
ncbi:MAG: hypothetical protein AAB486_04930 [Patescibacteria group bacterium]